MVAHGGTTYLTGLPRMHAQQSGGVESRSINDLGDHENLTFASKTSGFPDCYVLVAIPPDGGVLKVEQGPGSIRITS